MKTLFCLGRNGVQLLVVKRGKRYRERQVQFTDLQAALSWCRTRGVSFIWTPTSVAVANPEVKRPSGVDGGEGGRVRAGAIP